MWHVLAFMPGFCCIIPLYGYVRTSNVNASSTGRQPSKMGVGQVFPTSNTWGGPFISNPFKSHMSTNSNLEIPALPTLEQFVWDGTTVMGGNGGRFWVLNFRKVGHERYMRKNWTVIGRIM